MRVENPLKYGEVLLSLVLPQEHYTEERLRKMFGGSEVNINFHQTIIELSGNQVLIKLAENLFTHMRMIRGATIGEDDRVDRSIRDHMNIIQALEARDTERAEDLVRQHALGLAEHVHRHADYLD